jgi:hypothetical protein
MYHAYLGNERGKGGGHSRIDSIASLGQDSSPGSGRFPTARRDNTTHISPQTFLLL